MRILLDENTPRGVRRILTGHDVRTAPEMGWAAYSNGQLLNEAEKAGFDALRHLRPEPCFSAESHGPKYSRRDPFGQYLADHTRPAPEGAACRRQRLTGDILNRPLRPLAQIPASSRLKHGRSKLCKNDAHEIVSLQTSNESATRRFSPGVLRLFRAMLPAGLQRLGRDPMYSLAAASLNRIAKARVSMTLARGLNARSKRITRAQISAVVGRFRDHVLSRATADVARRELARIPWPTKSWYRFSEPNCAGEVIRFRAA
jgi:hypothetical protein